MAERRGETGKGGAPVRRRATGTRRAAEAPVLGDLLPGALELGLAVAATGAARVDDPGGEPAGEGEGDAAAPRRHARMSLSVEPHPLTRQHYRVNQDSAAQRELTLTYSLDGQHAEVRVTADRQEVVASGPLSDLLPSPQANDLLVVLGEEVNGRVRGRRWNFDSAVERTFSYGIPSCSGGWGGRAGGKSYEALLETARRLARLRVGAKGGAWREGGSGCSARWSPASSTGSRSWTARTRPAARASTSPSRWTTRGSSPRATGCSRPGTYWLIDGDPARRLYRILDMACYAHNHRGEQTIRIPVAYLRDRIPIDASKTAHITRALDRYHEELVRVGFLAEMPTYEPAAAEDFRRFPSYPGHRAKLTSAVYRVGRDAGAPAADRKLAPPAAGARAAAGAP
jgi:hypothetical protein